jgi:hypothetical protein
MPRPAQDARHTLLCSTSHAPLLSQQKDKALPSVKQRFILQGTNTIVMGSLNMQGMAAA